MAKCRTNPASLMAGAVLGAAIALMLVPDSRRQVRRVVRGWLRDFLESDEFYEGIEEEAGATEGGLAATRGWNP